MFRPTLLALVAVLTLTLGSAVAVASSSAAGSADELRTVHQEEPAAEEDGGNDREDEQIALAVGVMVLFTVIGVGFGVYGLREK